MSPIILEITYGLDFTFTLLLVGIVIFHKFILPVGGKDALQLVPNWTKKARILVGFTFLSTLARLLLTSADMTESWAPTEIWQAISQTSFGHIWSSRVGLILVLFISFRKLLSSRLGSAIAIIAVLSLPLFSSFSGHAVAQENTLLLRVGLDWLHSLAVGIWSGGLLSLFVWLSARLNVSSISPITSFTVVKRFSHFAMSSTGVIFITGLALAYLSGIQLFHPWSTDYGKLVLGKVFLFSSALAAASINQFIHLRKWDSKQELQFSIGVRREVRLEFIIVLMIFILAGFLTRTALPLD